MDETTQTTPTTSNPPIPSGPAKPAEAANINDAFASLESLAAGTDTTQSKEPEKPSVPSTPPKPGIEPPDPNKTGQKEASDNDKGPEKPPVKPEEPRKPAEKLAPKELRDAYKRMGDELDAARRQLHELKNKPAPKPVEDPRIAELAKQLEEREKRLASLDEEMRFTNYERSQEYQDRFFKPFSDAFAAGRNKVASITVTNAEGESRKGTAEDFDRLMQMSDDDAAIDLANDLFGNKAAAVLYHRERVIEANNARINAIETYRKEGSERTKRATEENSKRAQELQGEWTRLNAEAQEKFPQWFKPRDGDQAANELLERGFKLVDRAFSAEAAQIPPNERVRLDSAIRNKAGAFDRVAYDLVQANKRIKELEVKVEGFEKSRPGGGERRTQPSAAVNGTELDAALSRLDALAG